VFQRRTLKNYNRQNVALFHKSILQLKAQPETVFASSILLPEGKKQARTVF